MTFWKQFLGFGLLSVSALAIAACGGSDCGETGGGSTTVSGEAFQAGTFQLYTTEVSDKCLDGGLGLLFQPEGAGTEYMLANTTEFPGIADLPSDLVVQLEAPFSDMAATVEADGANMKIVGAGQENVVIDADKYGDCNADMMIDADITIQDNDNIVVAASLSISDWQGDNCPTALSDPCMVSLTMRGVRQN